MSRFNKFRIGQPGNPVKVAVLFLVFCAVCVLSVFAAPDAKSNLDEKR